MFTAPPLPGDEEKLAGIVTTTDILKAVKEGRVS